MEKMPGYSTRTEDRARHSEGRMRPYEDSLHSHEGRIGPYEENLRSYEARGRAYDPQNVPAKDSVMSYERSPDYKRDSEKNLLIKLIFALATVFVVLLVASIVFINAAPGIKQASDYRLAMTLLDNGDYAAAKIAFERLGNYADSPRHLVECENHLKYQDAAYLFSTANYKGALELFTSLAAIGFLDARDKTIQCRYLIAIQEFEAGNFDTAFYGFEALGDYFDSADRAQACIAPLPEHGVLYLNPAYQSTSVTLYIDASTTPKPVFLKIVRGETLVASIFLHAGGQSSIKLPEGSYVVREAYGEHWFGDELLFGSRGTYCIMSFDGNESVYFERNYEYTLSLFITGSGNVGNKPIDIGSF